LVAGASAFAATVVACSSGPSGGVAPPPDGGSVIDASTSDVTADAAIPDSAHDAAADVVDAGSAADGCPTDGGIPDDLQCTGLYSDWASKTVASDVMAYTPALVFWSDGAEKSRWLYLPPGSKIDTTDMDNWVFPVGTKVWKQFIVGGQLIETRLLWKLDSVDWTFLVYRWSADGMSATRLDRGETNVNGSTYEIPATNVCSQCHNGRPDEVLGIDFVALAASGATGVTIDSLEAKNAFTKNPPVAHLTIPEDSTGKAAAALGWLHVNCGVACHNANLSAGASATNMYMKLVTSQILEADGGVGPVTSLDTYTTTVGHAASQKYMGMTLNDIEPGHPDQSLAAVWAGTRCIDAGAACIQMPPIVTHVPDDAGLALINAWISALPPVGDQ
jgi:hypothetical protein